MFREIVLNDAAQGEIKIAILPYDTVLLLQGSVWLPYIQPVDGEALSHAMHGHATPLMRVIGPSPSEMLRKVSARENVVCHYMQDNSCMIRGKYCHPCAKVPLCYTPPGVEDVTVSTIISAVVQEWQNGYYVVYVYGEEFSIV